MGHGAKVALRYKREGKLGRSILRAAGAAVLFAACAGLQACSSDPSWPTLSKITDLTNVMSAEERQKEMETPDELPVRPWHWDIANRPSERDLLKAEIFLEEILEDYYGGGVDAAPMAQYVCIA